MYVACKSVYLLFMLMRKRDHVFNSEVVYMVKISDSGYTVYIWSLRVALDLDSDKF